MQGGFDLKDYLQQARAEGTTESEGHFTVSHEKALTKLAQFSLPRPFDWVLKIIQAVNLWNCPRLVVQQTREATSFYFNPPADTLPPDGAFVKALKTGSYDQGGPVDNLSLALRALVDQNGLSFVFASRRNEGMSEPVYAGDDIHQLSQEGRLRWSQLEQDGFRLTVSHFTGAESVTGRFLPTFFNQERRDLKIARLLGAASYTSRLPIYLDGLLVSDICRHPQLGSRGGLRPCGLGNLGGPRNNLHCLDPAASAEELKAGNLFIKSGFYLQASTWLPFGEIRATIEREKMPLHQILWIRHGVVVGRQSLTNSTDRLRFVLFRNADELRSDLSGLSVGLQESDTQETGALLKRSSEAIQKLPALILAKLLDKNRGESEDDTPEELQMTSLSIWSANLGVSAAHLWRATDAVLEKSQRMLLLGSSKKLIRRWANKLEQDLQKLSRDLRRSPRPLRPSDFFNEGF